MVKRLLRLYHSRLVSELRLLLPLFFFLSLILNSFSKSSFDLAKDKVLADPQNTSFHLELANQLTRDNQLDAAKKEFALANDPVGLQKISKLEAEPEDLQNQILLWEKIADQYFSYKDAYLKLAILNYKLGRNFDTKKFLDKALEIDPNNEVSKKVSSLL